MVLIDFYVLGKLPNRMDHKNKPDAMLMLIVFIHDLLIISWQSFYCFYYFHKLSNVLFQTLNT